MTAGKHAPQAGVTLIELLVALAVVTILVTVAVPGFQGLVSRSHLSADYNQFLTGLNLARSEAVKRRAKVTAVVTQAGASGWRLEVKVGDEASVGSIDCTVASEARCLLYRDESGSPVAVAADSDTRITFNALGRLVGASCKTIQLSHGENSEIIKVALAGRVGRTCV